MNEESMRKYELLIGSRLPARSPDNNRDKKQPRKSTCWKHAILVINTCNEMFNILFFQFEIEIQDNVYCKVFAGCVKFSMSVYNIQQTATTKTPEMNQHLEKQRWQTREQTPKVERTLSCLVRFLLKNTLLQPCD